MKNLINNRQLHEPISKLGEPFTYSVRLSYYALLGSSGIADLQPFNLAVPVFGVGMIGNVYSETLKWTETSQTNANGQLIPSIYSNYEQNNPVVPRNSGTTGALGIYSGSYFQINYNSNLTQLNYGTVLFKPFGFDYINFLNHNWKQNFLCTNINVQVNQKGTDKNYLQNQWTFFDQNYKGQMYTQQTALNNWINPVTNVNSNLNSSNIDIKCDWILHPYSGLSVGFNALYCDDNSTAQGRDGYTLNFTLQQIIK